MIDYMENKENFQILHGTGGRTKIGGKLVTKTSAFRTMAVTLGDLGWHEVSELNGKAMKKKLDRYLDKYKKVKILLPETGAGLSESEVKAGVSLEEKAELMCPNFRRMDALFGGRSNMDVLAQGCIGVANRFDADSGSESNDEGMGDFDKEEETYRVEDKLADGESTLGVESSLPQSGLEGTGVKFSLQQPLEETKVPGGEESSGVQLSTIQPPIKIREMFRRRRRRKVCRLRISQCLEQHCWHCMGRIWRTLLLIGRNWSLPKND